MQNGEKSIDVDITKDKIASMEADELLSVETFELISSEKNSYNRAYIESLCIARAKSLKITAEFKKLLARYKFYSTDEDNSTESNFTEFTDQPITLKCGDWHCSDNEVKKVVYNQSKGIYEIKIASPIPLLVTEILTNADEQSEKIRLAYYKSGWHTVLCNRSTVASNTKIVELADKGIEVTSDNAKLLVKYISDLVSLNMDIIPKHTAVNKMGWFGDDFMPYCDLKFDGENEYKALYNTIQHKGFRNDWVDYTHKLRTNKLLRLQMAASFSAPIVSRVNASPFVLHLWGGTGAGKTVGLMVASSIWGNPLLGEYTRTIDGTSNSIINIASFLNNLPFAGDELQTIKTECGYDKLIMKCTEGVGRSRMKYDKIQKLEKWKTVFLFTGEESCTRDTSGGGAKNRVIEIECTEKVVDKGNEVVSFISSNYGLVGAEYVKALAKEDLQPQYNEIFSEVLNSVDTTEKQAMAVSCMLLADKLACRYIYKTETPLTVEDIKDIVKDNKEVDISERAFEFVSALISENYNKFIGANTGDTWGKLEGGYIYVNKNVLEREMRKNGFEFNSVKRDWHDKGYITKDTQGRFYHNTKCFGIKSHYVRVLLKKGD